MSDPFSSCKTLLMPHDAGGDDNQIIALRSEYQRLAAELDAEFAMMDAVENSGELSFEMEAKFHAKINLLQARIADLGWQLIALPAQSSESLLFKARYATERLVPEPDNLMIQLLQSLCEDLFACVPDRRAHMLPEDHGPST